MMKPIFQSLATVIVFSLAVLPLRVAAQGSEISFRVLCFEHRGGITSAMVAAAGGAKTEVPLFTSDFSEVINGTFSGGTAALYQEEPGPDGKPVRKVVAEGKLATGAKQAFVLIPTDAATGPTYRIVAFDDDETAFPMGGVRVINLAPFPIRLNLAGSEMAPIKPGGVGMYPMIKKVDEWNMYTARIQFGVTEQNWVNVATQSWKASDRKRDWVIARFDVATKQPAIRQYQDIPPWTRPALAKPGAAQP